VPAKRSLINIKPAPARALVLPCGWPRQTLRKSRSALGAYYRSVAWRKGASVAVFATARKLAQLVYRLVRYGQAYIDTGAQAYEDRVNHRRLKFLQQNIEGNGIQC